MFRLSPNIAIQVENFEAAHRFYKEVMGFELKEIRPFESGREAVMKKEDVHFYFEDAALRPAGKVFFEFETEDMAAAEKILVEAGCSIYLTFSDYSKMVKDPYGMFFHLFEKGKI